MIDGSRATCSRSRRTVRVVAWLVVGLFVSTGSRAVHADGASEARVYFEQGNRSLEQGLDASGGRRRRLLEEALRAYVASLGIVRSRNVLYNAGLATEALGWHEDAFAYFRDYLAMVDLTAEERRDGEERLAAARARVAVIAIESDPPGADVRIDRLDLPSRGVTPVEVAVSPGAHAILFSRAGYAGARTEATAVPAGRVFAQATLMPLPVVVHVLRPLAARLSVDDVPVVDGHELSLLPGTHRLHVEDDMGGIADRVLDLPVGADPITVELTPVIPESAVYIESDVPVQVEIGGQLIGAGARIEARIPVGRRMLRATAPGYEPAAVELAIRADVPTHVVLDMELSVPRGTTMGWWPIATAVSAVATAAVATRLALSALDANNEFEQSLGAQSVEDQNALADKVDLANLEADVVWGMTGIFVVTTALLWVFDEDIPPPPSRVEVRSVTETSSRAPENQWGEL